MSAVLRIVAPGVLATVQDAGRQGTQRHGVPTGGAMDQFALVAANRLVGNAPDAAALELMSGAIFELRATTLLALTGADLHTTLDDRPLPLWTAVLARRGARLSVQARRGGWGARAYLAIAGGVDVPLVLGSRSTNLTSGFGGLAGRALRAGDELAVGPPPARLLELAGQRWPTQARPAYSAQPTLQLVPGPHSDCFTPDALERLRDTTLRLSHSSNRQGYRLEGIALPHAHLCSLPSLGVLPGVVQVPPDGTPILLMADAQTTGGYPIIGVVIAPDLPLAAQLLPGDSLHFTPVSLEAAVDARRTFRAWCDAALDADDALTMLRWIEMLA